MRDFELVLPAYNEAENLPALIECTVASALAAGLTPNRFQLVIVDNGSHDATPGVLSALKPKWGDWYRVVRVRVNQGYGYGLWQGLKKTEAHFVGWSHGDLQCDPSDAFQAFREAAQSPKTLVKGFRSGRNWKDRFVTRVFETLARVFLGLKVVEINAQPKVFSKDLLSEIEMPPRNYAFDLYVLYRAVRAGYSISTIPVLFPPRIAGFSKWSSTFLSRYRTILGFIGYLWKLRKTEGRLS